MNCKFKLNQKVWSPLNGWGVVILINDTEYFMHIKFDTCGTNMYRLDGTVNKGSEYPMIFHDKVDIKDWPCPKPNIVSTLKVDDPILVSKDDISYSKRHFAKYENSLVYTFANGLTSWSSDGNLAEWRYYELPNE
jgi:hypothetical protein